MYQQIQNVTRGQSVGPTLRSVVLTYSPPDHGLSGVAEKLTDITFSITAPDGSEYLAATPVADTDLVINRVYFATFATQATDQLGWYTVNWTFTRPNGEVVTRPSKFRMLDEAHPLVYGPVQIQDLIDEGVPINSATITDGFDAAVAARKLEQAYRFVEQFCCRHFMPTVQSFSADGKGGRMLRLRQPIIHITKVCVDWWSYRRIDKCVDDGNCYDDLVIYNRHIRQCMNMPDDRNAPKIDYRGCDYPSMTYRNGRSRNRYNSPAALWSRFHDNQQNVHIEGVFGYTDPDGTLFGCTPEKIKEAVILLTMKELPGLWELTQGGSALATTGPIYQKKTFDQSITFAPLQFARDGQGSAYAGVITGDPRIDRILAQYRCPPAYGAV